MRVPAESLSGSSVRDKIVTAAEAVRLVHDGDSVVVDGFMGQCFAEELTLALEQRFLLTGTPRDLGLVFTMAAGNRLGRGLDRLAHKGLLKRAVGGHWALSPELGKMAVDNTIEAHNLPQGVISQLFRDTAAGKPGLLTGVGLGTFVDPRQGGGKINERTTEDRVELITLGGEEYLFYKALPLDVAFLRGTTADPGGNITMEREALIMEALAVATAVHNAGGLVIVQVERVAENGSLSPREVKIPGILVDCVVRSAARAPLADFRHAVLGGAERGAAAGPQPGPVAGADRAEGHRPPGGDGASTRQRGESRHRHTGRRGQCGGRGAHPGLPHADR